MLGIGERILPLPIHNVILNVAVVSFVNVAIVVFVEIVKCRFKPFRSIITNLASLAFLYAG